ncbi:hypothetical protein KJ780_01695, partial [Candidatus Micrarchaeota archaeon]|nr:hypothetical protein [Candidatus Micrarchaeota archaeon]
NATVSNCLADLDDPENSCSYIVPDIPDCECIGPNCCINAPGSSCGVPLHCTAGQTNCQISCSGASCLNYNHAAYWNSDGGTCSCVGKDCTAPSTKCNSCFNTTQGACFFSPNVTINCAEECGIDPTNKPVLLTPSEFAKKSADSMFGREDIKNVSRLLVPAYLLPLINIVVTLMFIRGLSAYLGGDVEIPGFVKVL